MTVSVERAELEAARGSADGHTRLSEWLHDVDTAGPWAPSEELRVLLNVAPDPDHSVARYLHIVIYGVIPPGTDPDTARNGAFDFAVRRDPLDPK
ncbi:hypothetical protein CKO28_13350 [Rhodovibrio sodomensis]|uniref:Uncharacterized protein n=1 Tax=Rhodovibrio sodomensis TaxID=1088 RepID=A0ABS1DHM6_9PROT|nr:hypothetical protein [Rhodovibrio sodomensis]